VIKIDGDIDEEAVVKQIEKAGYTVERKKGD
jgi:copper chaperone CopZ